MSGFLAALLTLLNCFMFYQFITSSFANDLQLSIFTTIWANGVVILALSAIVFYIQEKKSEKKKEQGQHLQ